MHKKAKCFISLYIIAATIIFTGCWDKIEIEKRGFVRVIGIDKEKEKEDLIKVTYVFPKSEAFSPGGGKGDEKAFVVMSSTAKSIGKANDYIDSKINRSVYFGHMRMAVLGEELLKDEKSFKRVLDYIAREPSFSREIKFLSCDGEASSIGEIKPEVEKILAEYIKGIVENWESNGMIVKVDFNQFMDSIITNKGMAILPKISIEDGKANVLGASLIKDYKLVGSISADDTLYLNTLLGKRIGGNETIDIDNETVSFQSNKISRKIRLKNKDLDKLEIEIYTKIEGSISGYEIGGGELGGREILNIENAFNINGEERCKAVIKKLQKDYEVDVIGIGDYIKKFHPSVWEEVKDRWNEVYPNIRITPVMDYKVRRAGDIK